MNKELNLVLDAMIRQAKQSLRDTGQVIPFAAILAFHGKTSILLGPTQSASSLHLMRTLEAGLRARIGQGLSKAIGTCLGPTDPAEAESIIPEVLLFFLEHSDGTAYRITVPYTNGRLGEINQAAVIVPGTSRFFLNVMTRSA
jgi:hypothetical protein